MGCRKEAPSFMCSERRYAFIHLVQKYSVSVFAIESKWCATREGERVAPWGAAVVRSHRVCAVAQWSPVTEEALIRQRSVTAKVRDCIRDTLSLSFETDMARVAHCGAHCACMRGVSLSV